MTVKPEYRAAIQKLHDDRNTPSDESAWEELLWLHPDCKAIRTWAEQSRCDFIPFGGLAYMPEDFSKTGESYSEYDPQTGVWEFVCSLKNYSNEIKVFHDTIVAELIESIEYSQHLYEEYPNDKPWQEYVTDWKEYASKSKANS
jgi:hypothetical protein